MALRITFDYVAYAKADAPLSSFDLAHIEVSGEQGRVSTKGRSPAEMLFLVGLDLLDGIRHLLADPRDKEFVWAGNYGSRVAFRKTGRGIQVSSQGQILATRTPDELAREVFDSVQSMMRELDVTSRLAPTEAVYHDFHGALKAYREFLVQSS